MKSWIQFISACFLLTSLAQGEALTKERAHSEFVSSNRQINQTWAQLMKKYADYGPDWLDKMKIEQRRWLRYRDALAASPLNIGTKVPPEKVKDSQAYLVAATNLTRDRSKWLLALINDPISKDTLTGRWFDSYGGCLEIVQEGPSLMFTINVERGPSAHIGSIGGIASWNSPLGWFSDKGKDKDKNNETNLAFIQRDGILEVREANSDHYHGARAYFEGQYVRVAKLTPKEIEKVKSAVNYSKKP